ncbi:outer membrane beta-barrel protein [Flavobacterium taihuense]|uniref:Outer membrane beta-barrel protein n=1 Tax=Flavobacterium taihuense TaxID=2857508 RepID=A0ABS6Y0A2_9FLAO|nr:outer membrane beta-barrel protein [Flavobacterium taihuense]MBW4362062.1 outer membrane beta-barrel protein [Flavobacterium taihuense]
MKFRNKITKRILILFFVFFGMLQAQAQVSFRPGLRGGANFSHFTKGNNYYADPYDPAYPSVSTVDYSTKTDFYIGFYGTLKLSKYYSLQPEIDYSSQGSIYRSSTNNSITLDVDYLSFEVLNKFTFNDRFNMHFGPTLDFVTSTNFNTDANVDMAFVLGMGINLTRNFGIEGRVKKGIIPVVDFNENHTNVVFSLGGTYTFDVK